MTLSPASLKTNVILAIFVLVGVTSSARAADITVSNAWARATGETAMAGAAFLTIVNTGASDDLLIAASGGDLSKRTELHTHIKDGEVMRMRKVDSIAIPAGGSVTLEPGGRHVMFIGLNRQLGKGETFPLTLTFRDTGDVAVTVHVKEAGAMAPGHMNHN